MNFNSLRKEIRNKNASVKELINDFFYKIDSKDSEITRNQKVSGSSFLQRTKLCLIFLDPSSERSLIKEDIFSFKLRLVINGPNQ